jgi:hypothetical protein
MCRSQLTQKTLLRQNAFSQFVFWPNCFLAKLRADVFNF